MMTVPGLKLSDNSLRAAADMAADPVMFADQDNKWEWFRAVVAHIAWLQQNEQLETMKAYFDAMPRDAAVLPREPKVGDRATCVKCLQSIEYTVTWMHGRRGIDLVHLAIPGGER